MGGRRGHAGSRSCAPASSSRTCRDVSVAVGIDGEIVWAEGFGWANLEGRTPVAPSTRFRIGNVSSSLTSAAVGLLLEKQKLNLDDEIQKHVPEFPKKEWPVTVRQLMGHLAGIRNDEGDEEPIGQHCEQTAEGLPALCERFTAVRTGHAVPSIELWLDSGERGGRSRGERTVLPVHADADLRSARDDRHDTRLSMEPIQHQATFYFPRFAADTRYGPELAREGDYSCFAGAAAFLSTPSDLVRFGMAVGRGKLLQPATVELAPDTAEAHVGPADRLRPRLDARDDTARGDISADGGP